MSPARAEVVVAGHSDYEATGADDQQRSSDDPPMRRTEFCITGWSGPGHSLPVWPGHGGDDATSTDGQAPATPRSGQSQTAEGYQIAVARVCGSARSGMREAGGDDTGTGSGRGTGPGGSGRCSAATGRDGSPTTCTGRRCRSRRGW